MSSVATSYVKFDFSTLPAGLVGGDVAKATVKLWADSVAATGSFDVRRIKNFQIAHPVEPDRKLLVHSALEGPEVAVFYRGEAQLVSGEIVVTLPAYFEALTRKDGRTVQLTPIGGFAPLYIAGEVDEGRFTVRTESGNPTQHFYWEVKAVRVDIPALVVEKLK